MSKQSKAKPIGTGAIKTDKAALKRKHAQLLAGPDRKFHLLLRKLRKKAGYRSAIAFSEIIDVHKNTQSIYEKSGDPKVDYLVSFSYLTQVPFWQLMAQRVLLGSAPEVHKKAVLNQVGPLFGQANGKPLDCLADGTKASEASKAPEASDAYLPEASADTIGIIAACQALLGESLGQASIRVFTQGGHSMAPTINEGDKLFVDTGIKRLGDGDLFLFTLGQMHTIKRVQLLPSGGAILISDNARYQSLHLDSEDIGKLDIQGKLISSISHYG